jgi:hypothetical protein
MNLLPTSLATQPEWRSLRYERLLSMRQSQRLQGLVRDSVSPGWIARLYAGVTAATSLAPPALLYAAIHDQWQLPCIAAGVIGALLVGASLTWARAARELNRFGIYPAALGFIDMIRLRYMLLDLPYATVLLRYRRHFTSPADVSDTLLRIAAAGAKREGVFLDRALDKTLQARLFAGDLANRLVEISDDEPDAGRNVQQDLLSVAAETEWLNYDVAHAVLHTGFRAPI